MAEDVKEVTKRLNELNKRVEDLSTKVTTLQTKVESNGRGRTTIISKNRPQEVLSPDPFKLPEVIPPTPQEDVDGIVGGKETSDFPDCCAVGNDQGYYCTGTLIAPNVVVTAGHCTDSTRVFLRGRNVNKPSEGETIRVDREFEHPEADLRVLVLASDSEVEPRHVAQGDEVGNPENATLVGFGTVNLAGNVGYGIKRMVEVPIASLDCGTTAEQQEFGCTLGKEIVAGHRGLLKDSCRGDSGGPLYIRGEDGDFHLLGATSRGLSNTQNVCGDGGIYVRVDQFLDWVREVTGVDTPGPLA